MNQQQRRGVSLASLLATLAGVSLLLAALTQGAGASTGTTISSTSPFMGVGGSNTALITANLASADVGTLFGFHIKLQFNPAIATASVGPLDLGPGWSLQAVPGTGVDNSAGVIDLVAVRYTGCVATCPLFTIHWTGIAPGSFNLALTDAPNDPALGDQNAFAISWDSFVPGTISVNGPTNTPVGPTNTPVTPATNTPVTPATNTPVTPATNTPVTPATNTPVTPATSTPVTPSATASGTGTPATSTPVTPSATPAGTGTPGGTGTPSGTQTPGGAGTGTPTGTPTATPTIDRGPLVYKLHLVEVAKDGIPGSGQQIRALGAAMLEDVLGPLFGR